MTNRCSVARGLDADQTEAAIKCNNEDVEST